MVRKKGKYIEFYMLKDRILLKKYFLNFVFKRISKNRKKNFTFAAQNFDLE
jgi:hypothetical protein